MSLPSRTRRVTTHYAGPGNHPVLLRPWCLLGLSLLVIVGASALAHRSHPPAGADPDDAPRIIHIHRSDLRGTDPSGALRIRCRFCAGGGKTWHWRSVIRHQHIIRSYKDGIVPCPACDGKGAVSIRDLQDPVRIVPDNQPADYNEKRRVP